MRKISKQKSTWLFLGLISLILINFSGCGSVSNTDPALEHQVIESQGKRLEIIKQRAKLSVGLMSDY
ncbi:MAG: hypothetical protein HC930_07460 [Hydrococcus sp. SU_1_0]|nr:hypothetical protein [Hydrococcus sp. SU_1_0]